MAGAWAVGHGRWGRGLCGWMGCGVDGRYAEETCAVQERKTGNMDSRSDGSCGCDHFGVCRGTVDMSGADGGHKHIDSGRQAMQLSAWAGGNTWVAVYRHSQPQNPGSSQRFRGCEGEYGKDEYGTCVAAPR